MATDGTLTYAIFTYQCGGLNWLHTSFASIGFGIGPEFFDNHELSLTPYVNNVACINNGWSNVVYLVSGGLNDSCATNPCQNGGTCIATGDGSNYRCFCPLYYTGYDCEGIIQIM